MNELRDVAEVSCSPVALGPHPDPCEPGFIRWKDAPTHEEVCIHTMAMALQGQVADGLISEAKADRKLWEYVVSLEASPFSPGFHIMAMARV